MIKNNKWKAILSSLLILLPMVAGLILWDALPSSMNSHWGPNGIDGRGEKAFLVFGMPALMLGIHWLCLGLTALDPQQKGQGKKALGICFWIMPTLNIVITGSIFGLALGKEVNMLVIMPLLLGAMFAFLGNYMPKMKQNFTMGIKLPWTLRNEENWNKTHRLAGKLWVAAGLLMMVTVILPMKWMLAAFFVIILVSCIIPMVYSYRLYKKHMEEGVVYGEFPNTKAQKKTVIAMLIALPVVLALIVVLMFTGEIAFNFGDDALQIEASYVNDLELSYADIDSVEFRESFQIGMKYMGFNSAQLSVGTFQNEEFGLYIIYAYNEADAAVIVHVGEKVLVLKGKTLVETQYLYEMLLEKIPA